MVVLERRHPEAHPRRQRPVARVAEGVPHPLRELDLAGPVPRLVPGVAHHLEPAPAQVLLAQLLGAQSPRLVVLAHAVRLAHRPLVPEQEVDQGDEPAVPPDLDLGLRVGEPLLPVDEPPQHRIRDHQPVAQRLGPADVDRGASQPRHRDPAHGGALGVRQRGDVQSRRTGGVVRPARIPGQLADLGQPPEQRQLVREGSGPVAQDQPQPRGERDRGGVQDVARLGCQGLREGPHRVDPAAQDQPLVGAPHPDLPRGEPRIQGVAAGEHPALGGGDRRELLVHARILLAVRAGCTGCPQAHRRGCTPCLPAAAGAREGPRGPAR